MCASERVVAAAEAGDMVRHARLLGQATAHLITTIKTEAEKQPSEGQRKLLAAAKLLADATARMVEAARQCASEPQETLIEECKSLNEQIPRVVDAVKVSSLRPADPAAQLDLISASEAFLQGLELDAAAEIIKSLQAELDELEEAARALELRPLPSQTTSSRQTAASTAALVSGARRGEQASCARAAGDMAQALRDFSAAIRATAALQHDAQRTQQ
ncbi:hypothetical protein HF086_013648 [Spodoptera exigua]|uniref:Talin-1/2 VBS2 domain-containing protein n=1 Tax=Spodoptera exigua TaxID=7107 RepID=A0A922MA18_SPOEX|nr:hypothetical protein HF086_013648 [Spodoptera exigua]